METLSTKDIVKNAWKAFATHDAAQIEAVFTEDALWFAPPGNATGSVIAWIGVVRENPAASSPASQAGCRSNEEKVMSVNGLSLMLSSSGCFTRIARVDALASSSPASHTAFHAGVRESKAKPNNGIAERPSLQQCGSHSGPAVRGPRRRPQSER